MGINSRTRLQASLFGIKDGKAWVAAGAFVTRRDGDLLVEGWVGERVAAILVRKDTSATLGTVWEKLNEVAVDDVRAPALPV